MNAGMYGMADGRGMAGRKVARQLRAVNTVGGSHSIHNIYSGATTLATFSTTATVRQKLIGINGKGAIRYLSLDSNGSNAAATIELFVDGNLVFSGNAGQNVNVLVGNIFFASVNAIQINWDYIPFDSSVDVFLTGTSTSAGLSLAGVIEFHQ